MDYDFIDEDFAKSQAELARVLDYSLRREDAAFQGFLEDARSHCFTTMVMHFKEYLSTLVSEQEIKELKLRIPDDEVCEPEAFKRLAVLTAMDVMKEEQLKGFGLLFFAAICLKGSRRQFQNQGHLRLYDTCVQDIAVHAEMIDDVMATILDWAEKNKGFGNEK